MPSTRGPIAVLLAVLAGAVSPAARAALPEGFSPFVAVLTRYDDNVFRLSPELEPEAVLDTPHRDDLIRTALAGFELATTPGRQRLKLSAQASRAGYGRFDFLDHTGWDATMGWALEIGPRLTGTLEGSRTRRLESFTEFRSPELDLVDIEAAQARLRYALTARVGVGARAGARRFEHGLDSRRDGDSRSDELGLFLDYRPPTGNSLGFEFDRQDYGSPERVFLPGSLGDTGFRQYRAALVGHWSAGGRGALDGRAGYVWRRFDHVDRDTGGFSGRVDIDWALSGKTAFETALYREFTVVEELFASAVVSTGGEFAALWRPTWKTSLRAYARYDRRRFGQDPGLVPGFAFTQPTEVLRTYGAALSYAPVDWALLTLGYEQGRRRSDRAFFGFEYEAITLNVQVTL